MCRFLIYKGDDVLLADLITRPEHSLIHQSYHSKEREEPLNGDGFGLGWYNRRYLDTPCRFTSITPAWSNRNLARIADSIYSTCVFAHIRAATGGLAVTELNCHPFQYQRILWMHNGYVAGFNKLKRPIQNLLSDEAFNHLQGTGDSEHCFMLFLTYWLEAPEYSVKSYRRAFDKLFKTLKKLAKKYKITEPSHYNFALTDGDNVITMRKSSNDEEEPNSLYYTRCLHYHCEQGEPVFDHNSIDNCIIISSEPLSHNRSQWHEVPSGKMLIVDKDDQLSLI